MMIRKSGFCIAESARYEQKYNLMSSVIGLPDTGCDGVASPRIETPGITNKKHCKYNPCHNITWPQLPHRGVRLSLHPSPSPPPLVLHPLFPWLYDDDEDDDDYLKKKTIRYQLSLKLEYMAMNIKQ